MQIAVGSFQFTERTILSLGTEIARVQYLDAGLMIAVEGRHIARTSRRYGIGCVAEPQPEMVHLHRRRDGIRQRVNAGMRLWGSTSRRSEDEGLAAEYAKKLLTTTPAFIGVDIALVPGHRKRRRWDLEHEEGEARIRELRRP